jgi:hypothetical protein
VFTAPPSANEAITAAAAAASVAVAKVGRISARDEAPPEAKNSQVRVLLDGRLLPSRRGGYSHFGAATGAQPHKE